MYLLFAGIVKGLIEAVAKYAPNVSLGAEWIYSMPASTLESQTQGLHCTRHFCCMGPAMALPGRAAGACSHHDVEGMCCTLAGPLSLDTHAQLHT